MVRDELSRPKAPQPVREWIADPPDWLEVRQSAISHESTLAGLDDGEAAVIALAVDSKADLVLIDERRAARVARDRGFRVAVTLAVLGMAARRGLLVLPDALDRLKRTTFHCTPQIMDRFLAEYGDES